VLKKVEQPQLTHTTSCGGLKRKRKNKPFCKKRGEASSHLETLVEITGVISCLRVFSERMAYGVKKTVGLLGK